jgi:hypothetical protein
VRSVSAAIELPAAPCTAHALEPGWDSEALFCSARRRRTEESGDGEDDMSVQDGGEQVPAQPLRPKYTERSWKRADGKEGSKPCPRSVTGVVVAGPGRGEAFDVCVSKEHCAVHWGKEQREKKKRASAGPSDTEERAKRGRQKEEAARARVEAKRDRWRKSLGAILEAVAERVKKAPSGAGGLLGQIVLGASRRTAAPAAPRTSCPGAPAPKTWSATPPSSCCGRNPRAGMPWTSSQSAPGPSASTSRRSSRRWRRRRTRPDAGSAAAPRTKPAPAAAAG